MRILFFGSGAFGLPTLQRLAQEHELVGVVTQPDRPSGRGGRVAPTDIADWIAGQQPDVPVWKPENVNEPSVIAGIRAAAGPNGRPGADAWVVIAYGQKLSPALLDGVFAINLHGSLLPRWRGAAPINAAVIAGDRETGNSVITLADRMDAGLVLAQQHRTIEPSMTAGELHDLLAADGPALVLGVLSMHQAGGLAGRRQEATLVTRASKLSKDDGWVDFAEPADRCRARVHGLTPWPGVAVSLGGEQVKLRRVECAERPAEQTGIGEGVLIDASAGVVSCGDGTALRLLEVQPAGRRPMAWADFARGRSLENGMAVESAVRRGHA